MFDVTCRHYGIHNRVVSPLWCNRLHIMQIFFWWVVPNSWSNNVCNLYGLHGITGILAYCSTFSHDTYCNIFCVCVVYFVKSVRVSLLFVSFNRKATQKFILKSCFLSKLIEKMEEMWNLSCIHDYDGCDWPCWVIFTLLCGIGDQHLWSLSLPVKQFRSKHYAIRITIQIPESQHIEIQMFYHYTVLWCTST